MQRSRLGFQWKRSTIRSLPVSSLSPPLLKSKEQKQFQISIKNGLGVRYDSTQKCTNANFYEEEE
jgi:hypothetical protein